MVPDRLQLQRFELKYIINEQTALAVREFVRSYLEIDEFGGAMPNLAYPVHSLYLDSDDLKTYHDTINGSKNRFKLRLRFYDQQPDSPVFFEIKRRMNNCILKQRGGVRRDAMGLLLSGHLPEHAHMLSDDPKKLVAIQRFCLLMIQLRAAPKAHIAYLREAWISKNDNSVRVTLDRTVKCAPEFTSRLATEMQAPTLVFGNQVVLELKFTNKFPTWFRHMVSVFNLVQTSAAKYVDGVTLLGTHRLKRPWAVFGCDQAANPIDGHEQQSVTNQFNEIRMSQEALP